MHLLQQIVYPGNMPGSLQAVNLAILIEIFFYRGPHGKDFRLNAVGFFYFTGDILGKVLD